MPNDAMAVMHYDPVVASSITATASKIVADLVDKLDKIEDNNTMNNENIETLESRGLLTEEMRESVKAKLHSGEVNITFLKVDGTLRQMRATLDLDNLINEEFHPKNEKERKKNPDVQVVFDLDKNEWRSFTWYKLVEVN